MQTKITAHRGYSLKYPENTLVAFQKAVEYGADRVELDIHLSNDKKLIVHHDYYLGRTNNGEGIVYEKDSQYLRSLDTGSWFSAEFKDQKLPFLEEVFETLPDSVEYELELKDYNEELIHHVLEIVKQHNLLHKIEFTSFSQLLLAKLKQIEPQAMVGYFAPATPAWMEMRLGQDIYYSECILGNINYCHCALNMIAPDFIEKLHGKNIKVVVGNASTEEEFKRAFSLGVDGFATDSIELAVKTRNSFK